MTKSDAVMYLAGKMLGKSKRDDPVRWNRLMRLYIQLPFTDIRALIDRAVDLDREGYV